MISPIPRGTRAAIRKSKLSLRLTAAELGVSPSTVQKWRKREDLEARAPGPRSSRSLSPDEENLVVQLRQQGLKLREILTELARSRPTLTLSSIHRVLNRRGLAERREPTFEGSFFDDGSPLGGRGDYSKQRKGWKGPEEDEDEDDYGAYAEEEQKDDEIVRPGAPSRYDW